MKSTHFFDKYPAILSYCLEVNQELNRALGKKIIAENEVNFDLVLPFLFETLEPNTAKLLSKELRLHREIVDYYNSGITDVAKLVNLIRSIDILEPVSFLEYQNINKRARKLIDNDIVLSYLISTERVYYRFQILDKLKLTLSAKQLINQKVTRFSAFLLFDDDVYDLESDIARGKKTILSEFLKGNNLRQAINAMESTLIDGSGLFEEFTNHFKDVYSNVRYF